MSVSRFKSAFCSVVLLLLAICAPTQGQGDPARLGRWDAPRPWPIIGIHAAVLPTGEVFHLSYMQEGSELGTVATVWDPRTGLFRDVSPGSGDMFCSGQNFLPTGELFVAGGYGGFSPGKCKAQGIKPTYIFDPFSSTWRSSAGMASARFYPTVIALAHGRQLIIGGQGENCQYIPTMEILSQSGSLSRVKGPTRIMQDYPRVFLLSDGSLVHVAPEPVSSMLDQQMNGWTDLATTRLGSPRYEAAAFFVPGRQDRIMVCGGFTEEVPGGEFEQPTASCESIDPLAAAPTWRSMAPMRSARGDMNAVLLPDGKILIVGGGEQHRYTSPDLNPELYDPASNTWTVLPPQRFGRMYHSTAVLLPDGRVLSAGQDDDGSGDGAVSGAWGEVYNPSYLFRGARPIIKKAPSDVAYGSKFKLKVKQGNRTTRVVLMGLSAVTHSTNVGQLFVPLDFIIKGKKTLLVRMTKNPHLAPAGYYMLFVLNDKGVPSEAHILDIALDPADLG